MIARGKSAWNELVQINDISSVTLAFDDQEVKAHKKNCYTPEQFVFRFECLIRKC